MWRTMNFLLYHGNKKLSNQSNLATPTQLFSISVSKIKWIYVRERTVAYVVLSGLHVRGTFSRRWWKHTNKRRNTCMVSDTYSLVQWNWICDVTGCTRVTRIQWCQSTNFTAPGCSTDQLSLDHAITTLPSKKKKKKKGKKKNQIGQPSNTRTHPHPSPTCTELTSTKSKNS